MKIKAIWIVINVTMLTFAESSYAANETWTGTDGTGGTGNWSDTLNWTPTGAPGALTGASNGATTDAAVFNATATNNSIVIDQTGQNIQDILFIGAAGSYTIGTTTNPLYLNSSVIDIGNLGTLDGVATSALTGSNLTETISAPLILEDPSNASTTGAAFYNQSANGTGAGSAVLNITGSISGITTPTFAVRYGITLRGTNTNANTISGLISDGGSVSHPATLGIIKNDGGTWYLTNNSSSYSGQVDIFAGTLAVTSINSSQGVGTSALGVGGANSTNVNENGTNVAVSNNTIILGQNSGAANGIFYYLGSTASSNRPFLINNGSAGGNGTIKVATAGQTLTLSGAITTGVTSLSSSLTLAGPGNGVLSGGISNAGGMTLAVTGGNWTLSGASSFTNGGNTTVSNTGTTLSVTGSLNTTGTVTAGNGTTLMGNGNISAGSGVSISAGGTLQAGADSTTTGTTLTFNSGTALTTNALSGSIPSSTLTFVLAANHSNTTLALNSGSTNTFANGLSFNFLGTAATGTYSNLITGLGSDPGNEGTWLITTAGETGTFSYSAGSINLALSAVPEPSTWVMLFSGVGILLGVRLRCHLLT